ncbi:MAG TPA: hypothetical protein VGD92_04935 [Sphingobacteriaceae bacterium]
MRKRYVLPVFLFLFPIAAAAQDLSGKWFGFITQLPGAYSEIYSLELDLSVDQNRIRGESFVSIKDSLYVRIGLAGSAGADSIRLQENIQQVRQEVLPSGWMMCVKNIVLALVQDGNRELLQGTWSGEARDREPCLPGRIALVRNKEDLAGLRRSFTSPGVVTTVSNPVSGAAPPDFTRPFLSTYARRVTEIPVSSRTLQLQLRDYRRIDNDTVSVYLNREPLVRNIRIARKIQTVTFQLDPGTDVHEILLYAENLGQIPPNTSQLVLVDGRKTHRITIRSDKQESAAIYLRYRPEE